MKMAYVNFDSIKNSNQSSDSSQIGFFSLKNDGDEAIVRFMHDDTSSFKILGTHSIQLNGKFRRVNCVRTPMDPVSACPFCERGENTEYRFFITLLQYVKNPDGSVSVEPKVWERSLSYANKLKEYINNYGPMSDVICKIIRHGKAGDMKTEYEIIPNLNKQIYRDDIFVKKTGLFDDFNPLGRMVMDKSVAEIKEYFNTGNFPTKEEVKTTAEVNSWTGEDTGTPINWSVDTTTKQATWETPAQEQQPQRNFNWSNNEQQVQRPTRF